MASLPVELPILPTAVQMCVHARENAPRPNANASEQEYSEEQTATLQTIETVKTNELVTGFSKSCVDILQILSNIY